MRLVPFFIMFLMAVGGYSQISLKPLISSQNTNARVAEEENHTIILPLWDDFSTGGGILDTTWWTAQSQQQIIIKSGIGIDPPSVGVATFDGVDALGIPYLPTPTTGGVDSLVSQYIDLTNVPQSLRNTVYLSFFYQFKGLGEAPEEEDSLILLFKNVDGVWNRVWPQNSGEMYNTDPTKFTEIFTQVSGTEYFHNQFQFMFKAKGKQNGWIDNWLIDYVYLDKRRSASDNSYLDRTFVDPPSSIFEQYTVIPFDDFLAATNRNELFQTTTTKLRNLENDIQPVEYSVNLYDTLNKVLIENILDNKELILSNRGLTEISANALDPTLIGESADSLYLMLEYYVNSGDKFLVDSIFNNGADTAFYEHINLKQNDTIRSYFSLHDQYAYDDGTAEYGAGINQPLGSIAYEFNVVVGKYLDRIDIYFPNVQGIQNGTPLELFVLNDFENNENSLVFSSNIAIDHTGINEFIQFELARPIFVSDTFFIGFTNLASTQQWLGIGLDKNTDSFDKIFYNVDGNWLPNTDLHGSLMMRPHFTTEEPIVGIKEDQLTTLSVYPNPSNGRLKIEGTFNNIQLMDLLGKYIPFSLIYPNQIQFEVNARQILILQIETQSGIISKRIMASPTNQ